LIDIIRGPCLLCPNGWTDKMKLGMEVYASAFAKLR